jgi:hypothetical protein
MQKNDYLCSPKENIGIFMNFETPLTSVATKALLQKK